MKVAQWIKIDFQHQILTKYVVYKELAIPSNTHQMTPQISSQQWAYNGGNIKYVQNIDEVVSTWLWWRFATLNYFITNIGAPT
jgi:hypothetical protein